MLVWGWSLGGAGELKVDMTNTHAYAQLHFTAPLLGTGIFTSAVHVLNKYAAVLVVQPPALYTSKLLTCTCTNKNIFFLVSTDGSNLLSLVLLERAISTWPLWTRYENIPVCCVVLFALLARLLVVAYSCCPPLDPLLALKKGLVSVPALIP